MKNSYKTKLNKPFDVISSFIRNYNFTIILFIFILPLNNFPNVFAQSKAGTTIGQFLLIEPDAKIAAMGNAGVTSYDNIMASYYNPASLGRLNSSEVAFSHSIWLAGITYNYAIVGIKLGYSSTLALGVTSMNSGEIDVRTVEKPLGTGEKYSVSNIAISMSYGQSISEKFTAGLRLSYIQETIWHSSLSTVCIDFGTIYRISEDGLHIGASVSNYGFPAKYSGRDLRIRYDLDPNKHGDNSSLPGEVYTEEHYLPVLFRVGVGYPLKISEQNSFKLSIDAFHPSDNYESISMGAEWTFMDLFSIRVGYQNLFLPDSEVGLTLGSGLKYSISNFTVHADYAWAKHGRLGDTQRFTLGIQF